MNFQASAACLYGQQIMSKLKGYKLSVKDFRRNMLLKTRTDNTKAIKSTPLIQQSLPFQNKIKTKNSTETIIAQNPSRNINSIAISIRKKYRSNTQYNNQLFIQRESTINHDYNSDRRMNEYLSVVLKKAKNDTSKLLQELERKKERFDDKKRYNQSEHNNFIRRFKQQIKKIRLQKQRDLTQFNLEIKQNPQEEINNKNIELIKKIQLQTLLTKNLKLNKILAQHQNPHKILINSFSASDKQSISPQKIIKTKRQKSTR